MRARGSALQISWQGIFQANFSLPVRAAETEEPDVTVSLGRTVDLDRTFCRLVTSLCGKRDGTVYGWMEVSLESTQLRFKVRHINNTNASYIRPYVHVYSLVNRPRTMAVATAKGGVTIPAVNVARAIAIRQSAIWSLHAHHYHHIALVTSTNLVISSSEADYHSRALALEW